MWTMKQLHVIMHCIYYSKFVASYLLIAVKSLANCDCGTLILF